VTARAFSRTLLASAAFLVPRSAHAHLVTSGLGPFYDGVSHFAITPEDLLPALALALLAGQRGAQAGRRTLFVLPAAWLAGGCVGLAAATTHAATAVTAASLVLVGGLVASEARLRPEWVTALTLVVGLVHGYLNGAVMSSARLGTFGLAGIVAALFALVALAAAAVVATRVPWGRIAVRVAGSWIVAVGLLLVGWSLRAA
jgi:hydrogenase/urease accessory protein HupE